MPSLPQRSPLPEVGVGIDPAAHTGIAVVTWPSSGILPLLALVRPVSGDGLPLWYRRARAAVHDVSLAIGGRPCVAWCEDVPEVAIRNAFAGDRQGMRTAGGIGKRIGKIQAAWMEEGIAPLPELHPQRDWAEVLRPWVRKAKASDPAHRVAEAGMLVAGARARLAEIPLSSRIDCAEAILIAVAALWHARGVHAGPLPSEEAKAKRARLAEGRRATRLAERLGGA